ncbi:unnamed protein product (macronuclear) [Paramecium tetraurelia]|uniref:Myb-like domain-containing protein n=1 Tax=Paramecium tetraurelia TaxID=5888 RepID=A0BYW7_PARTE|nr:uncharacterized protein GSPATT00033587001 [Paramecium tetraurelia]CAK63734.1 unnamed protein product [Paramecium tetraurelia]|eukprot:XP_001431132.1 hypothetical protein (macronuclear) [Paramecium tetraurelia strain d4-2]
MVNQPPQEIKQKRKPWIIQTSFLRKLVKKFQNDRLAWKIISKHLKQHGFNRDTKACRERFSNHLDSAYNKADLTEKEIDLLFDLIEVHGNKWTIIAGQLNNRTDQDIKNKFYAHVKKIIRRLIKAAYQTTESSLIIARIQPLLISSIYCHDEEENDKILKIDEEMKTLFKQLIRSNKNIEVGVKVDHQTIEQVKLIMNYLGEQNDIYLKRKISKQAEKAKLKKLKQRRSLKLSQDLKRQQKIIENIKQKKPIFTTNKIKLENIKFTYPQEQQEDKNQFYQNPNEPIDKYFTISPYLSHFSGTFYWRHSSNIISIEPIFTNNFLCGIQANQNQRLIWSENYRITSE